MIGIYPLGTPLLYAFLIRKHQTTLKGLMRREQRGVDQHHLRQLTRMSIGSGKLMTKQQIEEYTSQQTHRGDAEETMEEAKHELADRARRDAAPRPAA